MTAITPGSFRVIAVNRSYQLVPWAECLYAADAGFWKHYKATGFKGWRFCADETIRYIDASVHAVKIARDPKDRRLTEMVAGPIGTVGFGGNSGYQAVNLAAQFGARRILLVGFDYCGAHWHPDHPKTLRNPTGAEFRRWAMDLDRAAGTLKSWGIEVLNLSPVSKLRAFPYADSRLFDSGQRPLSA